MSFICGLEMADERARIIPVPRDWEYSSVARDEHLQLTELSPRFI